MKHMTGPEALAHIEAATTSADLFGQPGDENGKRRAARTYRALAFVIHPDRAAIEGIEPAAAESATRTLTQLYADYQAGGTSTTNRTASPHVVGEHGTYVLRDNQGSTANIATYATDNAGVFVDIARSTKAATVVKRYLDAVSAVSKAGIGAFVAELLDHGVTSGRAWVAYRHYSGAVPLREVLTHFPQGLDGRDWAWMARRILIVAQATGGAHAFTLDNILIHPEEHGVIILPAAFDGETSDLGDVAKIFSTALDHRPDSLRQQAFASASSGLAPEQFRCDYDLLLRALYGERRYRPFSLPRAA